MKIGEEVIGVVEIIDREDGNPIRREDMEMLEAFAKLAGRPARAFAAPGWQASAVSRAVLASAGFRYASDTRGRAPYWPRFKLR